jgi:hypothetical protein
MTFGDALSVFTQRLNDNPALKPRCKEYCQYRIQALLKSWPGLPQGCQQNHRREMLELERDQCEQEQFIIA